MIGECPEKSCKISKKGENLMVHNKVYLPYSYYSLLMMKNIQNKDLICKYFDPENFFSIKGQTFLHAFSHSYKNLKFLLDHYER